METRTLETTVAEFFDEIEQVSGPSFTADDRRAVVAAMRADRE